MKKQILTFLIIILSTNIYSQTIFEKGYYADNEGRRTDGIIKIIDWRRNPEDFQFKSSDSAQPVKMTIDSITEFGIIGKSRYIRKKVKIDRSGELIRELSVEREPLFNEEVLFLRVLVEGKHWLYEYIAGNNLRRFFIESDKTEIEQLIYKSYLFDNKNIGKNNDFRKQLWLHLRCDAISMAQVEKTYYESNSLTGLFEKFNQCDHAEFIRYDKKARYDYFNLTLKPGLNISTLEIRNPLLNNPETNIGATPGFQVGFETEYILPFNKNKWAIYAEPGFQYMQAEGSSKWSIANITYRSFEIPIGLRHYFFLGDNSKIFINGSAVISHTFNSEIIYYSQNFLIMNTNMNASVGLGYKYKNRLSMELRTGTGRDLLPWITYCNCFSFILGYSVF